MKIVVLAGGLSPERDVSINSGLKVRDALRRKGHSAVMVDVYLGIEREIADFEQVFDEEIDYGLTGYIGCDAPDLAEVKAMRQDKSAALIGPNVLPLCLRADIVFMALHGEIGENGKLQALFDIYGIKYTGSGSLGSAIAMDKEVSKELFANRSLLSARHIPLKKGEAVPPQIPYPCIVKPCTSGSSIGVSKVNEPAALEAALKEAFIYDNRLLIEEFIPGREFAVAVMDGLALPVIEIQPKGEFFDYNHKYQAAASLEICPAELPEEMSRHIQSMAEQAFSCLSLNVYARMDFILHPDGRVFILEANTLPGMTPTSLVPQEAAAVGIDYDSLCELIIEVSLRRFE